MWESDCEESWAPKNWCFWTVVLQKTLESPLDCREIQPVHSEGDQPWDFFGRNDVIGETPVLWPPHEKSWLIGKDSDAGRDWGQEEKWTIEDEMAGWHHWLDGHESEWTPGVDDWQGGLASCNSWGHKESDMTEQLNWTELNWMVLYYYIFWFGVHSCNLSSYLALFPIMFLGLNHENTLRLAWWVDKKYTGENQAFPAGTHNMPELRSCNSEVKNTKISSSQKGKTHHFCIRSKLTKYISLLGFG